MGKKAVGHLEKVLASGAFALDITSQECNCSLKRGTCFIQVVSFTSERAQWLSGREINFRLRAQGPLIRDSPGALCVCEQDT